MIPMMSVSIQPQQVSWIIWRRIHSATCVNVTLNMLKRPVAQKIHAVDTCVHNAAIVHGCRAFVFVIKQHSALLKTITAQEEMKKGKLVADHASIHLTLRLASMYMKQSCSLAKQTLTNFQLTEPWNARMVLQAQCAALLKKEYATKPFQQTEV